MTERFKPQWEVLEDFLIEQMADGGRIGTNAELASKMGVSTWTATARIQAHLVAQRGKRTRTLFVLHREGRTKQAVWYAGVRAENVKAISGEFFHDVQTRFVRALAPDLSRIAEVNPRMAKKCESIVKAVGEGALLVLQASVDGLDLE
jgi:hypothetical protein